MNIQLDKKLHFACSFGISLLFGILFLIIGMNIYEMLIAAFSVSLMAGLGKEYADHVNPNNKWDWYDIIADLLGAISGLIIPLLFYI